MTKQKITAKKLLKQKQRDQKHQNLVQAAQKQHAHEAPKSQSEQEQGDEDGDIDLLKQQASEAEADPIDFLFVQLNPNHYHSLKNLLANYKKATNNNVSLLADKISKGNEFGVATVQDVEEGESQGEFETVFSLLTIVPLQKEVILESIKKHFVQTCTKYSKNKQMTLQIIDNHKCSLLINDRYLNLPPKLVPHGHETLYADLENLKKSEPNHPIIHTEYLFVITKGVKQGKGKVQSLSDLILTHFQDNELLKCSSDYWIFADDSKVFGKQASFNLYYVIPLQKYLDSVPKLRSFVTE